MATKYLKPTLGKLSRWREGKPQEVVPSRDEAIQWSEDLGKALQSPLGCQVLKEFILKRQQETGNKNMYESSLKLLQYIQRCDRFLAEDDPGVRKTVLQEIRNEHLTGKSPARVGAGVTVIRAVKKVLDEGEGVENVEEVLRTSRGEKAKELDRVTLTAFSEYLRGFQ